MRPDLQNLIREFVANFEVISQTVLAAQLAGFAGLFVVFGTSGEVPFLLRQGISHRKRQDAVSNTLGIRLHGSEVRSYAEILKCLAVTVALPEAVGLLPGSARRSRQGSKLRASRPAARVRRRQ